ncbi:MAG: efflux RND transporter periplasmic adaptor subunit [Acidobacteria bacterium]|nr:efflux RND transporter periplasmic adaptor subunit [Acidobacteriota bacterium]
MTMLTVIVTRVAVPFTCVAVLAGATSTIACGSSPAAGSSAPPQSAPATTRQANEITISSEAQHSSGISVAAAAAETRTGYFETPAVLQVNETRTARLGSLVDGVVTGADVQVGERVEQGQRVVSIHSHTVHDAWASYRKAMADRQRATAELTYARSAEARASRLLATKAVSPQEMERAATDRAAAEQALAVAESEVRRALDELEHLGIEADHVDAAERQDAVPVTTPLSGVVLERLVTSGTAVTMGAPLYVVSDLTTLWAIADVDEARLPLLGVGRAATIAVAAYPDRAFPARVRAIGDTVNPETRRVTARIEVDNPQGLLKPQMFATVRLSTGEERQVVVVPATAVQQLDRQAIVFVETSPGTFRRQPVSRGPERDGRVELTGIAPGTRIAVGGTFLLKSKLLESERPE